MLCVVSLTFALVDHCYRSFRDFSVLIPLNTKVPTVLCLGLCICHEPPYGLCMKLLHYL